MSSARVQFQVVLLGFASVTAQAGSLIPGNAGGHFVIDNVGQFLTLKHHGEALGWRIGGAPDPSIYDHYQGLARYPGTGVPIFYVTQKDDDDDGVPGGYLMVVKFGTSPTTGERLRSNLQKFGTDTEDTLPESTDTWWGL